MFEPRSSARTFFLAIVIVGSLYQPTGASAQQTDPNPIELANRGWAAVEEARYGDALAAFTEASDQMPDEASLWLGRGFAAYMLGRDEEAEASLEQSLSLDPRLTDASRFLGELYVRTGRADEAIETYEAALELAPADAELTRKLADWREQSRLHDRFRKSSGAHFRVLFEGRSDEALARRIVDMLETAYRNVGSVLRTYPTQPIIVVLCTQEQFQDITRALAWAAGVYDGQIRVPVRGALDRRDELQRVLTHEFVHALLAGLGGRTVPMWLHEGLATALEPGGLDRASQVLVAASSRPSLQDLHGSFAGLSGPNASVAYALSAVAVDRMIDLRGASAVVLVLEDLARGVQFESAFHRRIGVEYDECEWMARNLR